MEIIKIKIFKILPYWLIFLGLIVTLQFSVALFASPIKTTVSAEALPEVLGDATSIRGQSTEDSVSNIKQIKQIDTSQVKAKSFLVFDLNSGQELLDKNSNQKLSIASLTKLLTGLVTYQNVDLNHDITITNKDLLKVKPILGFSIGDSVKALDVFNSMIVGSGNDAAQTLANYVSGLTGQNFVDLMNRQAGVLGMNDSHFSNPMGFDSVSNYSTAEDIKKLIFATQSLAVFKNLGRKTDYKFSSSLGNPYSIVATNNLIRNHPDIQAIKTGYTGEAGGAMATKVSLNGHEVVILVLNSPNREEDTLKLKDLVLSNFQ